MIRLIGILCGSALAVTLLIVVLGFPEILPDTAEAVQPDTAVAEPIANPIANPVAEPIAETIAETTAETVAEPVLASENWYAFWTPFRSELAATGFIAQLQRTTGLDYRVLAQRPGVYAVAFAYSDDGDIQDKLTAISAATGLELPGG